MHVVSAAPISDETALKAHEVFGDAMYQGYGQTEILPIAMMDTQWFAKDVPGSQPLRARGVRLPFIQMQIWDEDNKPVARRDREIVAKCEGQMRGFWNNPAAMAERIVDGESGFRRDGTVRSSISLETRERTSLISQGPFRPPVPAGRVGFGGEDR